MGFWACVAQDAFSQVPRSFASAYSCHALSCTAMHCHALPCAVMRCHAGCWHPRTPLDTPQPCNGLTLMGTPPVTSRTPAKLPNRRPGSCSTVGHSSCMRGRWWIRSGGLLGHSVEGHSSCTGVEDTLWRAAVEGSCGRQVWPDPNLDPDPDPACIRSPGAWTLQPRCLDHRLAICK